jgi:uncharacterized membrane protein YphA (DoxX/SURF4 family)
MTTSPSLRLSNTLRDGVAGALAFVALASVPLGQRTAGGDTGHDAVVLGAAAALGFSAAAVHARLGGASERSQRIRSAAWTILRFFLAFEFVRYGVAKIVGMQFYRRFYLLDTRVVDLKPMNLAWSFFGHSYGYQAFSGALEIAGAVLLCFRRTTTLGACLLFVVMSNVVLVNFSYDVSVKLFSSVSGARGATWLARRACWSAASNAATRRHDSEGRRRGVRSRSSSSATSPADRKPRRSGESVRAARTAEPAADRGRTPSRCRFFVDGRSPLRGFSVPPWLSSSSSSSRASRRCSTRWCGSGRSTPSTASTSSR